MRTIGFRALLIGGLLLAASTPSLAGCICKDTRGTWCAKTCYACFHNHAVPSGYCSYWLQKRKHRATPAPS